MPWKSVKTGCYDAGVLPRYISGCVRGGGGGEAGLKTSHEAGLSASGCSSAALTAIAHLVVFLFDLS